MKSKRVLFSAVSAMALLGGCAVGPDYHAPTVAALGVPSHYSTATAAPSATDLAHWWTVFNDPLLTSIIAQATAGNLDIAIAEARYRQAREALVQDRAILLPTVTGSADAARNDSLGRNRGSSFTSLNGGSSQLSLGLDASWQADLFGGNRRSVEASRARAEGSLFNLVAVQTAVAGEVASSYIDARLAQARLAIAHDTLRVQDDNLNIAGWRVQAGLAPATDQEQARAQRAQTSSTIPPLETSFRNAVNRLAVLTGRAPGALEQAMATPGEIPLGPSAIAVGVPADALRQRPDVRAAERQLAAATAQIGVAEAQLYPALTLTGSLSTAAAHIGDIGTIFTPSLFGGLTQAIFNGGRLRSQVRSARAATDEAFSTYRSTILNGLEDAENAFQSLSAAEARQASLTEARDASQNAAVYARSQYRSGLTDFLTLLQSEQSLLSSRDALAVSEANHATAIVQLYLAVGGGWNPDTPEITGAIR